MPPARDIVTKTKRSEMMRAVGQRRTLPERRVQAVLREIKLRYRWNAAGLPGRPDFANRRNGWAIFVHGCFWHGHRDCSKTKGGALGRVPAINAAFWADKIRTNRRRDAGKARQLRTMGFRVLTVWECSLRDCARLRRRLARLLGTRR